MLRYVLETGFIDYQLGKLGADLQASMFCKTSLEVF